MTLFGLPENFWIVFGFAGQFIFAARFLVQWISSEMKKESHIPLIFWYLSIGGGVMLLIYAISRKDPVFILGQSCGLLVYVRNLSLISKKKKKSKIIEKIAPNEIKKGETMKMNILLAVLILGVVGCTSTKVERVDIRDKVDISGTWNDYDAMLVAEEMIEDTLSRRWLPDFLKDKGRNPVVIVGHIENRSHEHINSQVFTKYLERELLNSGKVTFVANPAEREGIRAEREDQQQGNTDPATMAQIGRERGADYMLIGSVNSVIDEEKKKSVRFYQTNLELINLTTNEKVWIGQKEIKKVVTKKKLSL